jgi:AcrR family transcriptional regulator
MSSHDNTVNINRRVGGYHHGDLRSALIETGLSLLADRKGDDISLREIARLVGVSATAVYRHFPDKQALIAALCERGEVELATAQRAAADAVGGGIAGFGASGEAYVRFALANPSLFRLMMSIRPASGWLTDVLDDKGAAMRGLREDVAAVLPGSAEAHQRLAAIHAWSMVHGMAMLMLDGMIPADEALIGSISNPPFDAAQTALPDANKEAKTQR